MRLKGRFVAALARFRRLQSCALTMPFSMPPDILSGVFSHTLLLLPTSRPLGNLLVDPTQEPQYAERNAVSHANRSKV